MNRGALLILSLAAAALAVALAFSAGQGVSSGTSTRTAVAPSSAKVAVPIRSQAGGRERPLKPAPLIKQVYRNNCETAGLAMMLAAAGVPLSQTFLQRELVRSAPLDPELDPTGAIAVWGDPDRGFVGRVEGGGVAGGFGVYQGPIRRLAQKHGVRLLDLSRTQPSVLYERVRRGRPVMAWIGLSEGPYRRWRTPAGKEINVNFGEHTVVLTQIKGDVLSLNDSLSGTRLEWSKAEFERRWKLLGMRALGL